MLWCALVEERFGRYPIWPTFEGDATIGNMGEHARRNRHVVLDDLSLGESDDRVKHLLEIGDLERAPSNLGGERLRDRHLFSLRCFLGLL